MREGTVEIHDPAVWRLATRRGGPVFAYFKCRGIHLFHHKISKRGSLDDPGSAELQLECFQLDVPLGDPSNGVGAPEHPLQRVGRDDLDWVTLEVVAQLT